MINTQALYNSQTPREILSIVLDSDLNLKFGVNRAVTTEELLTIRSKLKCLIEEENEILLRGISKSKTREKLVSKLNSNDSLYDGLFLVGDKAKNFLIKSDDIPHPIKIISSVGQETATWIFETYQDLTEVPIDITFFKENSNKLKFVNRIKNNEMLIDYYLFGLHTQSSDNLVNFVSTTLAPEIAINNQVTDKLIIFLWIPNDYAQYISTVKLQELKPLIEIKKLPLLSDSFYPLEKEFSFKGFILPHLIIGVHNIEENEFVFNPALLNEKTNWINDGLNIDQSNFASFIKQTKYKRFLVLSDRFEETNVC